MGNINYLWNITLLSKLFLLWDLWELYLFFSINYSNYKSPSILQTHGKTIHFIEMNKPKKANNKAQPRQSSPCAISQQLKLVENSFLGPHGITSLSTHATSTYYWFFGKIYLRPKISSYLIQLHGLSSNGPQDPYFKRRIHDPHFLFINWDHNPTTSSTSTYGLKLTAHTTSLTLMANGFFNKSPYLHKMSTKSKVRHLIFGLWSKLISLFGETLGVMVWRAKRCAQ